MSNNDAPTTMQIRTLAIVFGAIFVLAGYLGSFEIDEPYLAYTCWAAGGLFFFFGLFLPRTLEGFYELWMTVTYPLGWFMSRVILTVYYFLILTPWALLMRLFGKNPLDLRHGVETESYWEDFDMEKRGKKHFERQF